MSHREEKQVPLIEGMWDELCSMMDIGQWVGQIYNRLTMQKIIRNEVKVSLIFTCAVCESSELHKNHFYQVGNVGMD